MTLDNLASLPLLSALFTALLTLLLFKFQKSQQVVHGLGAMLYLLIVVYINNHIAKTGALTLQVGGHPQGFAISLLVDHFSGLMLLSTACVILAVAIYSLKDNSVSDKAPFYPAFWFMITGVTGAFSTDDLFNLYVWFEVMIAASIVVLLLSREKTVLHGAMHYVALNLLATMIMLLSIGFLYALSGTLDMALMAKWYHKTNLSPLIFSSFFALMMAFAIKAALFPYYFWLAESYHLTSVSGGAFFAGILSKVGVYALIRCTSLFLFTSFTFMKILLIASCFTMLGGVFGAMSDFHIRRILSFHTISQIGYMSLALAMGSTLALTAGIFYIIHNILVKTNLFLISGVVSRYSGQVDLRHMGGFFREKIFLAILFLIPALSIAGLPPFSGFWAKYLLLQSAFHNSFWLSGFIAVIVGFFTLYSMIKIWRYTFWQPKYAKMKVIPLKEYLFLYLPIIFLCFLTLMVGLFPESLYLMAEKAAQDLLPLKAGF